MTSRDKCLQRDLKDIKQDLAPSPDSFDFRTQGIVPPVTQVTGGLGLFYTVNAAMESSLAASQKKITLLSNQQIIDCITGGDNLTSTDVYEYIAINGLESAASYPETGKGKGACNYEKNNVIVQLSSWESYLGANETQFKDQLYKTGPNSVQMQMMDDFQMYQGGIYDPVTTCSSDVYVSLLMVGYGSEGGTDFWILQNFWGPNWGEKGYVRVARNKGNLCGIVTCATVPFIVSN